MTQPKTHIMEKTLVLFTITATTIYLVILYVLPLAHERRKQPQLVVKSIISEKCFRKKMSVSTHVGACLEESHQKERKTNV